VIAGYNQCAQIAARYGIHECLDTIIESLSKISTLATEKPSDTSLNTEVQAGGKSIMVSKFAVDFGRDQKAQLATVVLFRIINGTEKAVRNGWTPVSSNRDIYNSLCTTNHMLTDRSNHHQPLHKFADSHKLYKHLPRS
jgi:Sec7-like guanine-nucleotide exchange factor